MFYNSTELVCKKKSVCTVEHVFPNTVVFTWSLLTYVQNSIHKYTPNKPDYFCIILLEIYIYTCINFFFLLLFWFYRKYTQCLIYQYGDKICKYAHTLKQNQYKITAKVTKSTIQRILTWQKCVALINLAYWNKLVTDYH